MNENVDEEVREIPKDLNEQIPIFVAEFMEGYSFRGIIDYLKLTNVNGPFIFSKDYINYSQCDATQTILNNLEIRTFDLTHYQFNHHSPVSYGITLANIKQHMSVIGKKDGVRIISYLTQPFIFIQHLGQGNDEACRKNISMIRVQGTEPIQMTVEGYQRSDNDPNCTVRVQDFCKTCSNIVKAKSDYITIKSCPTGIRFQAMLDGSISGSYYEFGNFNKTPLLEDNKNEQLKRLSDYLSSITFDNIKTESNGPKLVVKTNEELNTIRVKSSYIKALSKLNNSFKEGTIKMYMEQGLPLKLIFNNTYAKLTVYLQNKK